eukprot:CAMPEP_0206183086 /NCGR_PEP_ID=MMETSP0166-20121206/435_1 /ASSEMBLY_ACC=CAM_ASM_000260 /TAXON_ID=95228 /ORGANISM="Vannella robusta, Strain DIVA3 518/3/11/1/6" /LENGTH=273 /DNA_ID=CAMNT_0053597887 /DNA_START=177 /DNA_END=998 /DNA_ORIENTATION=-
MAAAQSSVDAITELFFIYQAFMGEYYVKCNMEFYGDEIPMRESAFVISNHQWILDWVLMFSIGVRKGMAGACKFFAKKSILYIPGVGLGLWIMHGVFLSRNWTKDQASIEKAFERQRKLKGHPLWMTTYPESTRLSPEKRAMSHEFARNHGLPLWQHVLVPRTKGFVAQVQGLREIVPALYDLTIAYGGRNHEPPTPLDMGCGNYGNPILFYCKRYPMEDLPTDEEGLKNWLFDRWQEKEELLTYFHEHNKFPGPRNPDPFKVVPVWKKVKTE